MSVLLPLLSPEHKCAVWNVVCAQGYSEERDKIKHVKSSYFWTCTLYMQLL